MQEPIMPVFRVLALAGIPRLSQKLAMTRTPMFDYDFKAARGHKCLRIYTL